MPSRIFVCKKRTPIPAGAGSSTRGSLGLPAEMVRESARRLSLAAFIYAGAYALAFFPGYIARLLGGGMEGFAPSRIPLAAAYGSIGLALVVALLSRRGRIEAGRVVAFGLLFEVVAAFGIGMAENWSFYERIGRGFYVIPTGISWICVWMLVITLVLPARPKWAFLAAIAAATMSPLTEGISWIGNGRPPMGEEIDTIHQVLRFTPPYITALMAYFGARVIYGLGTDVSRERELGSYRLEELLGRGGMGEVWRARHRLLARPAAIKLIRPDRIGAVGEAATMTVLRRFEREAQATASLESPHSINLFDFGITDDRVFYYVMELLHGLDMETLVERFGPLPAERVVYLMRQACHSLMDAHDRGLIHRDVKPANLFVCRLGPDHDFVKVLDFGLVKTEGDGATSDARITAEGVASGTPAYMPPEVALGAGTVDERLDIYSLGCVAFWLLTGRRVFDGKTPMEIVVRHVKEEPPPPSTIAEMPVPEDLDLLVLSCLKKDPGERPGSARELRDLLGRGSAADGWGRERAAKWWSSHLPDLDRPPSVEEEGVGAVHVRKRT